MVPYFTQQILSYTNARRVTDLFAIAPYFGTTLTTAAQAAEVKRLGTAGLLAWLKSPAGAGGKPSNSLLGYGSLADVDAAVAAQVAAVRQFGVNLTSYEGVRGHRDGVHSALVGCGRNAGCLRTCASNVVEPPSPTKWCYGGGPVDSTWHAHFAWQVFKVTSISASHPTCRGSTWWR